MALQRQDILVLQMSPRKDGSDVRELLPINRGKIYEEGKILRGKLYILEWAIRNRNSRRMYL